MARRTAAPHARLARLAWALPALAGAVVALGLAVPGAAPRADEEALAQPLYLITGTDPGVTFNQPRGIAVDMRHGEILLCNSNRNRLDIYDLRCHPKARIPHRVLNPRGEWVDGLPFSIALDQAGHMLLSDLLAGYVDVLDYRGRPLARLEGIADSATALTNGPGMIAVAADGEIFVASRGDSGRVFEFSPSYEKKGAWGTPGSGAGQLSRVTGMAMTPDGNLVIACQNTALAVQVFDRQGGFIRGFGRHEVGPGNFSFPSGVVVTHDGRIWVADELRQFIQVFDANGALVGSLGGVGKSAGEFLYPTALASDGDSLLMVAERVGNRFQVMRIR